MCIHASQNVLVDHGAQTIINMEHSLNYDDDDLMNGGSIRRKFIWKILWKIITAASFTQVDIESDIEHYDWYNISFVVIYSLKNVLQFGLVHNKIRVRYVSFHFTFLASSVWVSLYIPCTVWLTGEAVRLVMRENRKLSEFHLYYKSCKWCVLYIYIVCPEYIFSNIE
jgi:hypothetical protein